MQTGIQYHETIRQALADNTIRAELLRKLPQSTMAREDLFQEVATRGLEAEDAGRYNPQLRSPLVYLGGIAKIVVQEEIRATRRRPTDAHGLDIAEAADRNPIDRLVQAERWSAARAALENVASIQDRDLILLRYGCLQTDDSQRLPLSTGQRTRLSRLLRRLRHQLRHHLADE